MEDEKLKKEILKKSTGDQWNKIGIRNHHGICFPLFSLHSENSCGIGEFFDLIPMIKWCRRMGMNIIQLLPLNDTGLSTSPYNAISANALSPIHITLSALFQIERVPDYQQKLAKIRYWNYTDRVKYYIVRELKFAFFREYVPLVYQDYSQSTDYQLFLQQNPWIQPYALFNSLKEEQLWTHWEEWPIYLKNPSENEYKELCKKYEKKCQFYTFLQYISYKQLKKVKQIATQNNILLKGDIPILISRDSVDVWHFRRYFFMNQVAGAPPDMQSREGQYWGFPTYNWKEIEKDGYQWWEERLQTASYFYHLYRIDHVVGFFRIWSIPVGQPAKAGAFFPVNKEEWMSQGVKLIKMLIQKGKMFPIAEDLGVVPLEIKNSLHDLGLCGTKMMRWERYWESEGSFIPINQYQPTTMTTVSNHDSDPLQLWWRHFPKEAKLFCQFKQWGYKPFLTLHQHKEILWDSHHSSSLLHINPLQEYLALFPQLISENPNNERINIPGTILSTNWTYRFRLPIEKITENIPLAETIHNLIK
ncbi:MAG: 4-alpha-glucanotransferase [Chlamydiales bacterium]